MAGKKPDPQHYPEDEPSELETIPDELVEYDSIEILEEPAKEVRHDG